MSSVAPSSPRSVSPATVAPSQTQPQQPAAAASRSAVPGSRDEFVAARTAAPAPAPAGQNPENLRASVDEVVNRGARNQMTVGRITVNGHTYTYRSGGHDRGNLPNGSYTVTPHLWNRNTKGMVVDGVGFSFALSDKYDPRVGATRSLLRIHPDGSPAGTQGCIGIVGNGAVQRQFREDMRAELQRNGGSFTLRVG
jgi:hypothetical protein